MRKIICKLLHVSLKKNKTFSCSLWLLHPLTTMQWYPWYPLHSSVTWFGRAEMAMEFEIVSSGWGTPHAAVGPMLKNIWKHIRSCVWSGLIVKVMLKKNWHLEKMINTGKSDLVRVSELLKMWRNYVSGNPSESSVTWKFKGKIGRKKYKNSKVHLILVMLQNWLFANKCPDLLKNCIFLIRCLLCLTQSLYGTHWMLHWFTSILTDFP